MSQQSNQTPQETQLPAYDAYSSPPAYGKKSSLGHCLDKVVTSSSTISSFFSERADAKNKKQQQKLTYWTAAAAHAACK